MSQQELKVEQMKNWIDVSDLDPDAIIIRKQYSDVITIAPDEDRTYVATISTTSVDSDQDIVWSKGCDIRKIMTNGPVLWSHQHSNPMVGKIVSIQINDNSIVAKVKMASTAFASELWELIKGGFLKTNSIGFVIKRQLLAGTREFNDFVSKNLGSIDKSVQRIISEFVLVEDSLCSIPSNSEALISAISTKSISVSDKLCKDMDIGKVEVKDDKACSNKECKGKDCTDKECTCSCHAQEVKAEPVVAPIVEAVKPEPVVIPEVVVIDAPKPIVEEVVKPIEFTLIREGGYKISESDKLTAKQIKQGHIVFV